MNFIDFKVFAHNLKLLRTTHGLTSDMLAKLVGLQGKGSISRLENAKNPPAFFPLMNVATLFSVDLDWLVGRVSYPYRSEIMIQEENELFPLSVTVDDQEVAYFPLKNSEGIPADYLDEEKRSITYSLPLRADILYVAHLMQFLVNENPGVANLPIHTDTPPNIDLYIQCIAWLHELFENRKQLPFDKQIPLFDILKA